jgi:hypothetical protein
MHDDVLHTWFIFNLHTRVSFVFTQQTVNVQAILLNPLQKTIRNPYLLGKPASCSWWQIPIHSSPLSSNNYPTLWLFFAPFTSFPPTAYITLFTMTTSTITVFFVWDIRIEIFLVWLMLLFFSSFYMRKTYKMCLFVPLGTKKLLNVNNWKFKQCWTHTWRT